MSKEEPGLPVIHYAKRRLRELALNLAHTGQDSTVMTISRAEAYYAFLSKND